MDGRPNRRNKAAFSNFTGVAFTKLTNTEMFSLTCLSSEFLGKKRNETKTSAEPHLL